MLRREGVVRTYQHHSNRLAVLVEVSTESASVANNKDFIDFTDKILLHILNKTPESVSDLLKQTWLFNDAMTVEEVIREQSNKFEEKIFIQSFLRWTLDPEK